MMKKSYICFYLTIAVCFLLGACQERNPHIDAPEQTGKLTVTMAQASFQDLAPKLSVTAVITRSGVPVTAIWNYARSYQVDDMETVQAPINIVPGYSYTLNSADSVLHRIIANTVTFLVAQKEEGQQEISYRVVRFIAQDDWLMDNPSKLFRLTLASLGSYTGKILYYDTSGRLLEGAVYQAGEQTGSIRPADADHFITRSEPAGNCYYEYITVSPTVASRSGDPTCEACQAYGYACMAHRDHEIDEVVVIGNRPTLWPCFYDTGGSTGGGTGGGGSGGTTGGGTTGGGNPDPDPDPENEEVTVTVEVQKSQVEVLEWNLITVSISGQRVTPKLIGLEMSRRDSEDWTRILYLSSVIPTETQYQHLRQSMTPGYWKVRAYILFNELPEVVYSNTVAIEERYPNIDNFFTNGSLRSHLQDLWTVAESYAKADVNSSVHRVREYGCLIKLRSNGTYYHDPYTYSGQSTTLDRAGAADSIVFNYTEPLSIPTCQDDIIVGSMHTHYPVRWAAEDCFVNAGPSSADNNCDLPGILYDYANNKELYRGHSLSLPKDFYKYGKNTRRPTLQ